MKDCHSEPDLTEDELLNFTAHPACDETCLGDCLYLHSEAETEAMLLDCLAKYRESKLLAADGADLDDVEYNMIMDVFMVHHNDPASKRSEALLREGVKHIHDSFRNRGEFHDPEGVDIKINWSVGNIYYINGETLWGTDYVTYGCNMSSTLGIRNTELYRYCKELAGTLGDGTRTCLIAPHKITHSSLRRLSGRLLKCSVLFELLSSVNIFVVYLYMEKSYLISFKGNDVEIIDGIFTAEIKGTVSQAQLHAKFIEMQDPYIAEKIQQSGKKVAFFEISAHC